MYVTYYIIGYSNLYFKGFNSRIEYMSKYLLLILLFSTVFQTAIAGKRPTPSTPKAALVVQIKNDRINHTSSHRDSLLAIASQNYCKYYRYIKGEQYDTLIFISRNTTDSFLEDLRQHKFTDVVYVNPTGIITSRNRIVADSHNRRRVAKIDGYLDFTISYSYYNINNGQWRLILSDTIIEQADPNWNNRIGYSRQFAERHATPEPYEYIIQRAISKMYVQLPALQSTKSNTRLQTIPVRLFIAPSLYKQQHRTILSRVRNIVSLASFSLEKQFQVGLAIVDIDTTSYTREPLSDLQGAIDWLSSQFPRNADTLMIIIHNQLSADEYFHTRKHDNIGLSQLGKNRIAINLLPAGNRNDHSGDNINDGLVLLHEIGHSFGAIHTSDIHAVMSHTMNWVSSDWFDPVNSRIIRAALHKELTFEDLSSYLHFVSQVIQHSSYYLTDYPEFFYHNLTTGQNRIFARKLRSAIRRTSFVQSADAYGLLLQGKTQQAAGIFRKLIYQDPKQAALYYYLSVAGEGSEARNAHSVAVQMGFLKATSEKE